MVLPTSPAPGFGGLLLGGIVARFASEVPAELMGDLLALSHDLESGRRIPQPRLRHRYQDDRVGLSPATHRLVGRGESVEFEIDDTGKPEPHVLGAFYAAGRLEAVDRPAVFATIRRGLSWTGPLDHRLVDHLGDVRGGHGWSVVAGREPVMWALSVLGLEAGAADQQSVQRRFRDLLRTAHPDHGGEAADAAGRIRDLTEARRILIRQSAVS